MAGGVAVGAIADMIINPYGSMVIGSISGAISTLGFQFLTPFLNHHFLHDSCGVNNLHGIPGLISGITSAVIAALANRDSFQGDRLYVFYPSRIPKIDSEDYIKFNLTNTEFKYGGLGRTASVQAGYQLAALGVTLGIAIFGGLVTGLILRIPFIEQVNETNELFDDQSSWITPKDFLDSTSTSNSNSNDQTV